MEQSYFKKEDNLLTELGNWNKIEQLCAGVYGEASLKDRSFQRMKMQEYRRLYNKYGGREHPSLDEQALHKMLRYQLRKIEMHLYPNPVRRVLQRGIDRLTAAIEKKLYGEKPPSAFVTGNIPIVPAFSAATSQENNNDLSRQPENQAAQQRPEGWWIQNLGQRDNNTTEEKKLGIH